MSDPESKATVPTSCEAPTERFPNEDQRELSGLLRNIKHDPTLMGVLSLGSDGVMRSLTADRDVVDAIPLPPHLIKAHLDSFPIPFDQKIEDLYRGVDGTKVPKEQWYHPDKSILPPPLSKEKQAEARESMKGRMDELKPVMARLERGEPMRKEEDGPGCPIVLRNNYDLSPEKGNKGE